MYGDKFLWKYCYFSRVRGIYRNPILSSRRMNFVVVFLFLKASRDRIDELLFNITSRGDKLICVALSLTRVISRVTWSVLLVTFPCVVVDKHVLNTPDTIIEYNHIL